MMVSQDSFVLYINWSNFFSTNDNVYIIWCSFKDALFKGFDIFANYFTVNNSLKVNGYPSYIKRALNYKKSL